MPSRAELLGDVGHDPAVRRRCRREHRNLWRHLLDEVAQPSVIGPEVVTPVADAVRLVDHEHPDPSHECRQLLLAERRVVESLGRDEQHVDLISVELLHHLRPLMRVGGVDGHGSDARTLGGGDLVAHQSEKWRHQHGRPRPLPTQQQRRDEVHRRFAPPRALHDERAAAPLDQRLDRLILTVVEVGV